MITKQLAVSLNLRIQANALIKRDYLYDRLLITPLAALSVTPVKQVAKEDLAFL